MPSTHMFETNSDGGETYRIFVSYPKGEAPEGGCPVLYVIDRKAYFSSFAETRRLLEYADRGKALVVGVGYLTDDPYDARRTGDFLFPIPTVGPPAQAKSQPKAANAGRDKFLDFLTGKALPQFPCLADCHRRKQCRSQWRATNTIDTVTRATAIAAIACSANTINPSPMPKARFRSQATAAAMPTTARPVRSG